MQDKKIVKIKFNSIIIMIIVGIVIIATIIAVLLLKNTKNNSQDNVSSNVKNVIENISETEKKKITEEVIEKLNKKYGNSKIEVLNMEKGFHSGIDYDVIINEKYFNINVQMENSEHKINFVVDYINKTDNLIESLESDYKQNIIIRLKDINNNVDTAYYSLSDYNEFLNDSKKGYMSLDTIYGKIPSQEDIDFMVQDLNIYCKYDEEVKNEEETRNFINTIQPDIKKLYNYISQTFPRIPKGTGATSVEIYFGNGVVFRIFPLSRSILAIQGNNTIDYNWKDIL